VISVLVLGTSRGPLLFRQQRVGHGGRVFEVLKFRTMYADAEARAAEVFAEHNDGSGPLTKLHVDPRVTPVGRWLRRLSLDELPQLWNVVNGTMALVGPRPNTPTEVARFEPAEHRRHAVRPGMTGLAQVNGRSDLEWDEAVLLDLEYVDHHCVRMDLHILLRTLPAVFGGRGAY
jgi:lipopolysaccharide/colanic/teichoic acid biosynthesis glycosyltransferase